jgi:Acetyltransferase (GNAT) domain
MGEVKVFTEELADGVARLYLRAVRGQIRAPGEALPKYFRDLHFSNPWTSTDMPTLVYLEKGEVVGTIGVVPRPMEFRGRPIILASMSIYMVHPEHRRGPAAIQLLGRMLKGPQDMSWTDGASGAVSVFWGALGGHTAPLYAFNWIRVLRPFGTARMGLERIGKVGRLLHAPSKLLTGPSDFLLSKLPLPGGALRAPSSPYHAKPVSAEELLKCIQAIGWREPLKPSYSLPSFPWLMNHIAESDPANFRMLTVTDQAGAECGWLIYQVNTGGASWVFQIGARKRTDFPNVLAALFKDAWEQGAVAVKGASIPQYLTELTEQKCIFRHPHNRVVFHAKDPGIVQAMRMGDAAITKLDGTSWLRLAGEKW